MVSLCPSRKTQAEGGLQLWYAVTPLRSSVLTISVAFCKPGRAKPLPLPGQGRREAAFQELAPEDGFGTTAAWDVRICRQTLLT